MPPHQEALILVFQVVLECSPLSRARFGICIPLAHPSLVREVFLLDPWIWDPWSGADDVGGVNQGDLNL